MKHPKTADGKSLPIGPSMQKNSGGFSSPGGMGPRMSDNPKGALGPSFSRGREVSADKLPTGPGASFLGEPLPRLSGASAPAPQPTPAQEAERVRAWLYEIARSGKRLEKWHKAAKRIVSIFEAEQSDDYQYNILYANTETLAPALYNSLPRPVVQRRFRDADPMGKAVSSVTQRVLEYLLDDNLASTESFDDLMKSATLSALVPGWGVVWFHYDAEFKEVAGSLPDDLEEGEEPETVEVLEGERIVGESIPYNYFRHGYGKKWSQVPWVARLHKMTKQELASNFGDVAEEACLTEYEEAEDSDKQGQKEQSPASLVGNVWEIWDKSTRHVYFVLEGFDRFLKVVTDDPLGLSGFFPCPRPLTFVQKVSDLTPVPLYKLYEEQARELNAITVRINKLVRALKVRGMYDSTVQEIGKVLTADDNQLIPAENVAALVSQGMTLEKSIWLMPIEKLTVVLQQLYAQREQVKQVIYEITGIADIMRGSSAASETLGAQQIKQSWGTLRMKRLQREVSRFARDSLRILVELSKHFSLDTLRGMTGLSFPTETEQLQAKVALQQAQMTQQPQPPELLALLSQPTWESIQGVLNNDVLRPFKVDVETNSTVDAEATEDKQQIADVMNAISQFLNGVAPLVEQGSMPFDVAKEILLTIVRRYRFGPDVEDKLMKMAQPQPKPDPTAEKAQAQMQLEQEKAQLEMRARQMEIQAREAELQMEMTFRQQEHQFKLVELQQRSEAAALSHRQKMQTMAVQALMPKPAHGGEKSPRD